MATIKPTVSVIVPTRNSARFLEPCLRSIELQTYPSVELIVVDNHSTDDTPALARQYADRVLARGPERSAQRNHGAREARGTYLLFVDSDMVLDRQVVNQCVEKMETCPSCIAVAIPEISVGEGFWAQCKALERSCYVGEEAMEAGRFFAREAFERAGGYDEGLAAFEDWELSQRMGANGTICRATGPIHHMEGRLTLAEAIQTKFYYGRWAGRYLRKHSGTAARRQFAPIRGAYIRHWRTLIADPPHLAGFIVLKSCELIAGGLGAIVGVTAQNTPRPG